MNGELPKGWVWTSLGEISQITSGNPAPQGNDYFDNGKYPFVRVQDMGQLGNKVYIYETRDYINHKAASKMKLFQKGSVLFTKSGMSILLNQRAILGREMYVVSHIGIISPISILPEWIYYWLKTKDFKALAHATTLPSLPLSKIVELEIPLTPLAEQQRIVNKIEELFTNLDKGIEFLEEVKYKLKIYRQAILKYAMEGKLTEKWREENKDKTESELIEFRKFIEENQKNISNELNYIDSPNSWIKLRLSELSKIINPGFPCGRHNNEGRGVPHLRPMNIDRKGRINLSIIKYVETEDYDPLSKGDILFNNTNSSELIGKTAYIDSDTKWAYSNHMTRIRINNSRINNKWISSYLHFLFINGYFGRICIHHVNQSSVSSKVLSERIPIPIPSFSEQNYIIENIEQYFSLVDKNYEIIKSKLAQSKLLRQSILKKAFEGKLVPQDPNDEPAEILLEKIKLEKQKSNKEKLVQEKLI